MKNIKNDIQILINLFNVAKFDLVVIKAKKLMHGKTSMVTHDNKHLFNGLPNPFEATRYHSLVLNKNTVPDKFEVTATSDDGEIMGIRHKTKLKFVLSTHKSS